MLITRVPRKRLSFGFGVVAVVLAMSSAAYACTVFRGSMTVVGDAGGSVTVVGNGSGMGYCGGSPTSRFLPAGTEFTDVDAADPDGGTVSITVASASCKGTSLKLSNRGVNGYDVNYTNGPAFSKGAAGRAWLLDCMSPRDPAAQNIGKMTIDSLGSGSGSYAIPPSIKNGPTDESAVCVSSPGGGEGLQAPVNII